MNKQEMDISFKISDGRFNYRVCAVIINDNKLLAMHDENSLYFYLPGGRVKLHETVENAILREVKEELGIDVKIDRPLWVHQAFFTEDVTKERFHELCVYFLIDIKDTNLLDRGLKFKGCEKHHTNNFEWLEFNRLQGEYIYPLFIKKKIFNLPQTLILQNEIED